MLLTLSDIIVIKISIVWRSEWREIAPSVHDYVLSVEECYLNKSIFLMVTQCFFLCRHIFIINNQ
jgi:hypothetical protein